MSRLVLRRLSPHLGAEISGVEITDVLEQPVADFIQAALTDFRVVVISGQTLSPDQQLQFTQVFGKATASSPLIPGFDHAHPQIRVIDNRRWDGRGQAWHANITYVKRPPRLTTLYARVVPPEGGDTEWASTEAAYESLDPAVRAQIDRLSAVHDARWLIGRLRADGKNYRPGMWEGEQVRSLGPCVHPVVRVSPETGRRSLFVNPLFTTSILGLPSAESGRLLAMLFAHIVAPEHVLRHRWSPGTMVVWDNLATIHRTLHDRGTARRVLHRVSLRGEQPVGPRLSRNAG